MIPSRSTPAPSDALALAVRFGCPIFTYEHILDSAGILMEDSSSKKKKAGYDSHVSLPRSGGTGKT
jgi:bifunctional DNase/RNase